MKKALLLVSLLSFLSVTSLVFFASKTSAQANQNKNAVSRQTQNEKEAFNDKTNLKQTTYGVGEGTMSYILNQVAGCFSEECMEKSAYLGDGGAVGGVGRMISKTFLPVASTETYIADLLQNMNIAQPAYAQGLGFSALQPVLNLWKIFRDISYVFFVFIFLIIGFAIMFRKNLGGQAAVTVQQALPRIIVALLAVSFSYAIAGLLIDFMWIAMYFLITMFGGAGLIKQDWVTNYEILNQNIFSVFGNIISSGIANNAGVVVGDLVSNMLNDSGSLGTQIGEGIGWITGILGTLIVFIAILFAMFKTFFSLIKVYFEIIMTIIFAPVALMMGAINGNAFGNWLKSLIINLAVFPVLLVFIIIGYMLINVEGDRSLPQQLQKSGFIPPFVPGGTQANQIGLVGGIAAIMFLPEVVGFVTKNKPSSIFDEIAPKAWQNAMRGRGLGQAAVGLGGGLIAGGAGGALVGGINAARALRAGEGREAAAQYFQRDLKRGLVGGAGAGGLAGGFRYIKRAASTVDQVGRGIKEGGEMYQAGRQAFATWKQQRAQGKAQPPTGLQQPNLLAMDNQIRAQEAAGTPTHTTIRDIGRNPSQNTPKQIGNDPTQF